MNTRKQYSVWTNPETSHLARWVYTFWGDLRDDDNAEEVIAYFNRITERPRVVRGGTFEVYVEGEHERLFNYDTDKKRFVEWQRNIA